MAELEKCQHLNHFTISTRSRNIPDDTVSAFTDHILNIVLLAHVERDLAGPRSVRGVRSRHDCCRCEGNETEVDGRLQKERRKQKRATETSYDRRRERIAQSIGRSVERLLK